MLLLDRRGRRVHRRRIHSGRLVRASIVGAGGHREKTKCDKRKSKNAFHIVHLENSINSQPAFKIIDGMLVSSF